MIRARTADWLNRNVAAMSATTAAFAAAGVLMTAGAVGALILSGRSVG